jgi:Zn-dependent protease with chaperone function
MTQQQHGTPFSPAPLTNSRPVPAGPTPTLGPSVDARAFVAEGTGLWLFLAWMGLIVMSLIVLGLAAMTFGIVLIAYIISAVMYFIRLSKSRAAVRGSGLAVGPAQFPEIYRATVELASRLGLSYLPEVYIVESTQPNASALRLGAQSYVLLQSGLIKPEVLEERPDVVRWVLAHELAHHALGHTDLIRGMLARNVKNLSRRDEFSCDAVAHALVGDMTTSRDALTMLLVGPELFPSVDGEAMNEQIRRVVQEKNSRKAEGAFRMSHPLLLRRMARLSEKIKI